MTAKEAKEKYGSEPYGYVSCVGCPIRHLNDGTHFCGANSGYEDCWRSIADYMTEQEGNVAIEHFEHDGCKGCKHDAKTERELPCSHCKGTVSPTLPLFEKCADLYEPEETANPYWERICKLADKQRAKGIETYGQGIESNPMDIIGRFNHLEEELIDALMYCEWIKDKLMELEKGADRR